MVQSRRSTERDQGITEELATYLVKEKGASDFEKASGAPFNTLCGIQPILI